MGMPKNAYAPAGGRLTPVRWNGKRVTSKHGWTTNGRCCRPETQAQRFITAPPGCVRRCGGPRLNVTSSVVLGRTRWLAKFPKPWTSQNALTNGASANGGGDRYRDHRPAGTSKRNSVTCRIVRAHATRLLVWPSRGASIDWSQERLRFRHASQSDADSNGIRRSSPSSIPVSATQKYRSPHLMHSAR